MNLEGIYQFSGRKRVGAWAPYFIHQSYQQGRNIDFGNFDYETGFNALVGVRRDRTFVELKSSLWSGPAPRLRVISGYNF